jgi:hypothetical protein
MRYIFQLNSIQSSKKKNKRKLIINCFKSIENRADLLTIISTFTNETHNNIQYKLVDSKLSIIIIILHNLTLHQI